VTEFFRRLFKGRDGAKPAPSAETTAPLKSSAALGGPTAPLASGAPQPLAGFAPGAPGSPRLRVGFAQDTGRVRAHNEDVLLAFSGSLEGLLTQPAFGLFIVADGMGGHSLGERASAVASRTIAREIIARLYLPYMADPEALSDADRPPLNEVMRSALEEANRVVSASVPEGGTTGTAALVLGDRVTIAHVGDSRVYLILPDHFERLTRDHSLVERLQELGQLSAQEAAVHPQKNVLYRALGQGDGLEVDVSTYQFPMGARMLACSDGLWGYVPEEALMSAVRNSRTVQEACDQLVQLANDHGGPDNISAIVVEMAY
jgi:serine/threonine protein phosphatase PrpC